MSSKLLNIIGKSIPTGIPYYIVKKVISKHTKKQTIIQLDGPWSYEEISKRFKKLRDKDAYIAVWDGKWIRQE